MTPTTRPRARALAVVPLAAAAALLVGCTSSGAGGGPSVVAPPSTSSAPATSSSAAAPPSASPEVSGSLGELGRPAALATGLTVPWGLAFLPDGSALVAERPTGVVVRVAAEGGTTRVGTVPGVRDRGEGGLLGLAVSPDGATVFAYLTTDRDDNRVVAMPYSGGRLGEAAVVIDGIPQGDIHNGGRIAVGPDGNLWIGTGDSGDRPQSQDRSSLAGKILRVGTDGSVPADNPFPGSPVWSYGHRNVQGLAFDSQGRLWATEFGQNTYDELNLVRKGGNFGWPEVEGAGGGSQYVDPVVTWPTDQASPSGVAIVDDVAYIGALRGERLWQVPLRGSSAGEPRAAFRGDYGRIRTVQAAPDGSLWITTSNRDGRGSPSDDDDRVLRVTIG
ncbi:MAG: sorbosone dehydrogenase family protein [Candidatus Nanopelagicales bacterium]|jgi:glucose/arabinose dehydrogenase